MAGGIDICVNDIIGRMAFDKASGHRTQSRQSIWGGLYQVMLYLVNCMGTQSSSSGQTCADAVQVKEELAALQVSPKAIEGILQLTQMSSLAEVQDLVGPDSEAVQEIRMLFELAEAIGIADFLEFDPSIVRGLAYYTGAGRCR